MRSERAQPSLLQLPPEEIVKYILLLLAMTKDGATDIARVILVSKRLKEMAMSEDILRAMSFGQAQLPKTESFWNINGLIIRSARANNQKSYEEIMKRIKEKIDDAYAGLDFAMPLLENCNAIIKDPGVFTRSTCLEIRRSIVGLRGPVLSPNFDMRRAESMINKFGRQYFQCPELILLYRFEYLQPNFDKCYTGYLLLERYAARWN